MLTLRHVTAPPDAWPSTLALEIASPFPIPAPLLLKAGDGRWLGIGTHECGDWRFTLTRDTATASLYIESPELAYPWKLIANIERGPTLATFTVTAGTGAEHITFRVTRQTRISFGGCRGPTCRREPLERKPVGASPPRRLLRELWGSLRRAATAIRSALVAGGTPSRSVE